MIDTESDPNSHLRFSHLFVIIIAVGIWVLAVLALILFLPSNVPISPAVWLHGTAILLLLFMLKRFGYFIKTALAFNPVHWPWLVIATLIAVIYWFFDHWLMTTIFCIDGSAAVKSWQLANSQYHISSVFISSVILAPVFEELFFRGLVFHQLSKKVNVWVAALFSAVFFAAIHWSWPEFLSLVIIGLVYAYLLNRSNSLLIPLIAHLIHNLITFMVYFY